MEKTKVGIFYGGNSPEHDVSKLTAKNIIEAIDKARFDVIEFFIDKEGQFDKKQLSNIDVAFPALHGVGGEDGTIQGFFKTLQIPYVGNDVMSSALCLDKDLFNKLMVAEGFKKPSFVVLDYDRQSNIESIIKEANNLTFPLFIKPAHAGSSIGITKIKTSDELKDAIKKAREFDEKIIIEEAVPNCLEIEVSILGNNIKNIKASLPGSITPGADFYDYDDKYNSDQAIFEIPASLGKSQTTEIQELAKSAYLSANCKGLARVDFLVNDEAIYLNEINTMPGFTSISMYPKLWEVSGLNYQDLITELIELALE